MIFIISVLSSCALILTIFYYKYKEFININFRKDDVMIYEYFMKYFLKVVSPNDYMNYGLWDNENNTLEKANINLCRFVFSKINANKVANAVDANASEAANANKVANANATAAATSDKNTLTVHNKHRILDVGCGYGCQDLFWVKNIDNAKIYAIDISEKQIEHAIKVQNENNISNKRLSYNVGNALTIRDQFKFKFDTIISLESAFHYSDRPLFFNNVYHLLKDDGVFVITDIMLNDNSSSIMSTIFMKLAIDFFNIPERNLIRLDDWKQCITDNGLECIELHNITDKTFNPYYTYFFSHYFKNSQLLATISTLYMNYIQPFTYVVAVCKKRDT
jgi:cyclopropane fatty-acyl-phospholipid synthase-like methyltransferase